MLSGLIGSILENRKLKIIIVSSLISLIFYFIWPAIINPLVGLLNLPMIILLVSGIVFLSIVPFAVYLKRLSTCWIIYFIIAIDILFYSASVGGMFIYIVPNFFNIYYPLIYLAGYVVIFLLYLVFNFATDRDPMGPVIVVFVGFMVVSMAAAFIALFAFNYPGIPLPPVE